VHNDEKSLKLSVCASWRQLEKTSFWCLSGSKFHVDADPDPDFKQHMESFLENGSIYQLFHLIGIDTVPYRSEPVKIMQIRLNPGPRHWQLGLLNFFQLVKFGPGFGFGLSTWTPRSKDRVLKVTDPEMQFLKDCFSRGLWAWAFSDSSFLVSQIFCMEFRKQE